MLGLDTNILLRYHLQDHPEQSARAIQIVEHQCTPERPGFVAIPVLTEYYWTLRHSYKYSAEELAGLIEILLVADNIVVEHADAIWHAIVLSRQGFGFADALIGYLARKHNCSTTLTFDQKAARMAEFTAG